MSRIAVFGGSGYLASLIKNSNNKKTNTYTFFSRKKGAKNYINFSSYKKNINILKNTKGGYETNILSAKMLEFVIENNNINKKYIKDTKSGMDYLKYKLDLLKLGYFGGENGNFIFINFKNPKKAYKVYKGLKDKKIATRYSFNGQFRNGILVTGCPKPEMKKFVKIFIKLI